jgi:hypothetical protein
MIIKLGYMKRTTFRNEPLTTIDYSFLQCKETVLLIDPVTHSEHQM